MTARRSRGRPPLFDDTLRDRYLAAVTTGMYLKDAATHVGISENIPQRHARTDASFARALQAARAAGKKVRDENIAHGEYRHLHHGCPCEVCTRAARIARTRRRYTATTDDDTGGQVIDLPAQVPHSFSLLKAS